MKKPSISERGIVSTQRRSVWKIQIDNSPFWYQVGPFNEGTTVGSIIADFCAKMSFNQDQVTDIQRVENAGSSIKVA